MKLLDKKVKNFVAKTGKFIKLMYCYFSCPSGNNCCRGKQIANKTFILLTFLKFMYQVQL